METASSAIGGGKPNDSSAEDHKKSKDLELCKDIAKKDQPCLSVPVLGISHYDIAFDRFTR